MIWLYPNWREALKEQWDRKYRRDNLALTGHATSRIKALEKLISKGQAKEKTK